MQLQTIKHSLQTINWLADRVVDWARAGESYSLAGNMVQLQHYYFGFSFDSAIHYQDGHYVFLYQKLGTKALLLKDGEILREINRSYYQADVYEYPAAFFTHNNKVYLAHCPISYCQLDFEDVETGAIVTNTPERKPADYFHSRLELSPGGTYLLSKGWVWHPSDVINVFSVGECMANPLLLDKSDYNFPDVSSEICTAGFIDDNTILIGSSAEVFDEENVTNLPAKSICTWNVKNNEFSHPVTPSFAFGNLFPIDDALCWDIYKFPKIINLLTGEIIDKAEGVWSGEQRSSILIEADKQPQIAFDAEKKRLAIKQDDKVVVLTR